MGLVFGGILGCRRVCGAPDGAIEAGRLLNKKGAHQGLRSDLFDPGGLPPPEIPVGHDPLWIAEVHRTGRALVCIGCGAVDTGPGMFGNGFGEGHIGLIKFFLIGYAKAFCAPYGYGLEVF